LKKPTNTEKAFKESSRKEKEKIQRIPKKMAALLKAITPAETATIPAGIKFPEEAKRKPMKPVKIERAMRGYK